MITLKHCYSILHEYDFNQIYESFSLYAQAIVRGHEKPKDILKLFSYLQTDEDGHSSFVKLEQYLNN